jgi:hypothetical protein
MRGAHGVGGEEMPPLRRTVHAHARMIEGAIPMHLPPLPYHVPHLPPTRPSLRPPQSRTLNKVPTKPEELPTWNYDGSSTGQAPGDDSEVYLVPRAIFRDPFRGGDNILVLCDAYEPPRAKPDGTVSARLARRGAGRGGRAGRPWGGLCSDPLGRRRGRRAPARLPEKG